MFSDSLRLQVPFHVRMDDVPSWDAHTVQNILPSSNSNHGKAVVSHRSLNWRAGLHVLVVAGSSGSSAERKITGMFIYVYVCTNHPSAARCLLLQWSPLRVYVHTGSLLNQLYVKSW